MANEFHSIAAYRYADNKMKEYRTACCKSGWFGRLGWKDMKCFNCKKGVTDEIMSEYHRLLAEYETQHENT